MKTIDIDKSQKIGDIINDTKELFDNLLNDMENTASKGEVNIFKYVDAYKKVEKLKDNFNLISKSAIWYYFRVKNNNFIKNALDNADFIGAIDKAYKQKISEYFSKDYIINSIKENFNEGLNKRYDEKYTVLDYYMISYLTEEKSDLFEEVIPYFEEKTPLPEFKDGKVVMPEEKERPKYFNEVISLFTGQKFINIPWILGYALDKAHCQINDENEHKIFDEHLSFEKAQNEIMDEVYDEAVDAFYKQYPEVKEYVDKHPLNNNKTDE